MEASRGEAEPPDVDPEDLARPGVDSDCEEGPLDPEEDDDSRPPADEDLDAGEQPADEVGAADQAPAAAEDGVAEDQQSAPALPDDISKLKVAELKLHLQWRGLATSGKKDELKARLADAISQNVAVLDQLPGGAPRTAAAGPSRRSEPVEFEPIDANKIDRPVWTGPVGKFEPADHLNLAPDSHPMTYVNAFYDPSMRGEIVQNSIKYQGFLQMSKGAEAPYPDAPRMDLRSVAFFHATLLLQGLNPVPSQRHLHHSSFSLKGHRAADLWARDEWIQVKAHIHVSDPAVAPKFGDAKFDELYKVRPLLDHILTKCVANVKPGREASIDEITIGFQGHHARLKQRCGKFKRAGDGFQVSCLS